MAADTRSVRPTILVVDDVDVNVMILEEILQDHYTIITACNGVEALKVLRNAAVLPKIILLDVMMPEMTGREMFDILKADTALQRIPVIFITAENDSESELLAAGAVDFINKPFKQDIVRLRVQNQIALKNYSDDLEAMVAVKTAEATATLDNALQGLANVIEHRDLESGEHVKRTQLLIKALMDHIIRNHLVYADDLLALKPDIIVKSMALHDVGKIAIPDRILLKQGRLDSDEFEIMKTHTTRGKEIIGELGDVNSSLYLMHCEDICYGHHERFDGKGYPRGLAGTGIPLAARLAAIADVYDALVCARVYKAAIPYAEAVAIITEGRGAQFDPYLTDAMIQIQDQFEEITRNNQ
ncbi:two-component system response regulator [Spirochaetia bacterium]|nr:two-component system response regulator [Spirochaetia bacterium]